MAPLYDEDLAHVHTDGYGALAKAALRTIVPLLAGSGARTVVDAGCGPGVTTASLAEAGFEVVAIEPSPAFCARARAAAPTATVRCESIHGAVLPPCEAVLGIGEVFGYHPPDVDARGRTAATFREIGRALRPGGVLVFDLIIRGPTPLDAKTWSAGTDWAVLVETRDRGAALSRNIEIFRTEDGRTYRRSREVHPVHVFEEAEVLAMLAEAGFRVTTATSYGDYPLAPRRLAFTAVLQAG